MAKLNRKGYTPRLKFQVVLEMLQGRRTVSEIAKAYGVHPITLGSWRKEFLAKGPAIFGGPEGAETQAKRVRELERLVGQKDLEIALLKNFLDES